MLEDDYRRQLDALLATSECKVTLPREWKDLFTRRGALPSIDNDRRRFVRFHFPSKAVLELEQTLSSVDRSHSFFCVFTKDVSRDGISFFHAGQLYPGEKPVLWLAAGQTECMVVRCVRHSPQCFEIGAMFCVPSL